MSGFGLQRGNAVIQKFVDARTASIQSRPKNLLDITRKTSGPEGKPFAPSPGILWPIIDKRHKGTLTPRDYAIYRTAYIKEMGRSFKANRAAWLELLSRDEVTLGCYCHKPADACHCHRVTLAWLLLQVGLSEGIAIRYEGEISGNLRVAIVGARSWEPEELVLLNRLGVRIFTMAEVNKRGLPAVLCEAMSIAREGTAGFGVSVDLDSMDCAALPATTCLVPDGLDPQDLVDNLHGLRSCADLVALEIVEYVPSRDRDGSGARWVMELAAAALGPTTATLRQREDTFGAHNYAPLPVVFTRGKGSWLWDVEGRRYLDMMSAYSAVSFGHSHPRLVRALTEQAGRLALTSRAYSNDRLPQMLERLTASLGYDRALPVNTGLEAVETALKAARKWAYTVKGVPADQAEIIVCDGNFHGRSTTIVGFSSEAQYKDGFGPFAPGFRSVPFGDAAALEAAITPNTAAFLFEPIQGEGGIRIPPAGWLARCAELCRQANVLLIADEVQTGLGRTGVVGVIKGKKGAPKGDIKVIIPRDYREIDPIFPLKAPSSAPTMRRTR